MSPTGPESGVTSTRHPARPPDDDREDTTIRTDTHSGSAETHQQPAPDPAELVELLEAHLADLNTLLALNTMALAALGIATAPLGCPGDPGVAE